MRPLVAIVLVAMLVLGCSAGPTVPTDSQLPTERIAADASPSPRTTTPAASAPSAPSPTPIPTATPLLTDAPDIETPDPVEATEPPTVPPFPEPPGLPMIAVDGGERIEAPMRGGCGGVWYLAEMVASESCGPAGYEEALGADPIAVQPGATIAVIAPADWQHRERSRARLGVGRPSGEDGWPGGRRRDLPGVSRRSEARGRSESPAGHPVRSSHAARRLPAPARCADGSRRVHLRRRPVVLAHPRAVAVSRRAARPCAGQQHRRRTPRGPGGTLARRGPRGGTASSTSGPSRHRSARGCPWRPVRDAQQRLAALDEPRPEDRVREVRARLVQPRDRVADRHRRAPQPGELRELVPDPVAGLPARAELARPPRRASRPARAGTGRGPRDRRPEAARASGRASARPPT